MNLIIEREIADRAAMENGGQSVTFRQMQEEDIAKIVPLYIEYRNSTGDNWTPEPVLGGSGRCLARPTPTA